MNFEYVCHECELIWQRECRIGKAPTRTRCPKCKVLSERFIGNMPGVHFKGMDFHTNQVRAEKFQKDGMDKETANKFLKTECDYSKDRAVGSASVYKRMVPKFEKMVKDGTARRCSDKEIVQRKEKARQITADWYSKAGKDPHRDINPNLNSIY